MGKKLQHLTKMMMKIMREKTMTCVWKAPKERLVCVSSLRHEYTIILKGHYRVLILYEFMLSF